MDCRAASRYNISFILVTICPPATAGVAAREGDTCLYLPGLYWAAFSSSRRAARYLQLILVLVSHQWPEVTRRGTWWSPSGWGRPASAGSAAGSRGDLLSSDVSMVRSSLCQQRQHLYFSMYEVTQEDVDHKIVVPESLRRSDWIIDESTSYLYLF